MKSPLLWQWLGLLPIETVLEAQELLFQNKLAGTEENYLLLCEHHSVYTIRSPDDLRYFRTQFKGVQNIPIVEIAGRGGKITFHGPGQLVAYLIAYIPSGPSGTITHLVGAVEHAIMDTLSSFGIASTTRRDLAGAQGVWIGLQKIASLGFAIRLTQQGMVTRFGFALNISTDLSYFARIFPCGLDIEMTSMKKELGEHILIANVIPVLLYNLAMFLRMSTKETRNLISLSPT